jgi:hypothetical protein
VRKTIGARVAVSSPLFAIARVFAITAASWRLRVPCRRFRFRLALS